MKKLKNRKGVMTIELALLFPFFILMIFIMTDSAYLFFLKSGAGSQIDSVLNDANTRIFEMTNKNFSNGTESAGLPAERLKERLKMRINDEMFFGISNSEIENKIINEISKKLSVNASNIKVKTTVKKGLFSISFSVEFEVEFKSLLSNFFKKIYPDFVSLKGKKVFNTKNHFTDIVNIEIVSDVLSEKTGIDEFFESIKDGVSKLVSP